MSRVGALPCITDITVLLIITCGNEYALPIERNNTSALTLTYANKVQIDAYTSHLHPLTYSILSRDHEETRSQLSD